MAMGTTMLDMDMDIDIMITTAMEVPMVIRACMSSCKLEFLSHVFDKFYKV